MLHKNTKKITLIMRDFSRQVGGAERFSVNLAEGLLEKGLHVELWGGSLEPGLGLESRFKKISFMKKPSSFKVWSFCSGYQKLLHQETADLAFGVTQVYPVDVYRVGSGIYPNWMRIQYPNPIHRFFSLLTRPVYWANRVIEKRIMTSGRLKKVVVNSRLEKKNLLHFYRVPENKIEVIYNGVDLEKFHPDCQKMRVDIRKELETSDDAFVLLFPSNNFKRKGLDTLMRAVSRIQNKGLSVWVAGQGREASFRSLSKVLQVDDQVHFLGRRSDMEKLYGAADCMVLPTRYDSFSNVVLEAMACDLPVITTQNNGASEAVEPGAAGYILEDYEDDEGLAERIRDVMENRESFRGMARKRAEDFSPEKSLNAYLELFQELS